MAETAPGRGRATYPAGFQRSSCEAVRTSTGVTVGYLALTVKCEYVEIHMR